MSSVDKPPQVALPRPAENLGLASSVISWSAAVAAVSNIRPVPANKETPVDVARNALARFKALAQSPSGREVLALILTGKSLKKMTKEELAAFNKVMKLIVKSLAELGVMVAPTGAEGSALPPGTSSTYLPDRNAIMISPDLKGDELKAAMLDAIGGAIAKIAGSAGALPSKAIPGSAGLRLADLLK